MRNYERYTSAYRDGTLGAHSAGKSSHEGAALSLQDFIKLLRSRWLTVCVTTLVAVAGAGAVTMLTTTLYQASTTVYVATAASRTGNEDYSGVMAAQQRVQSYTKLLTGQTLAQRTVDKLQLGMSADTYGARLKLPRHPSQS